MIETKTQKFFWPYQATVKCDHIARDDRAHEGLRGERVDSEVQGQEIDAWLKESVRLVEGCVNGLAENQRRVRYFGFETTHEEIK